MYQLSWWIVILQTIKSLKQKLLKSRRLQNILETNEKIMLTGVKNRLLPGKNEIVKYTQECWQVKLANIQGEDNKYTCIFKYAF